MKKILFVLILAVVSGNCFAERSFCSETVSEDTMIKIEIPSADVEKVDIKYEKDKGLSVKETLSDNSKNDADKKSFTDTASEKTKSAAEKTKGATVKTYDKTKSAAKKTADVTKKTAKKTVYETKDIIDAVNPNKVYTPEELKTTATVKTLKNERNEIKSAYNSRIKDVKAKIKSVENSKSMSEVKKRDTVHKLNLEKDKLEKEKASYINKYDERIEAVREKNK